MSNDVLERAELLRHIPVDDTIWGVAVISQVMSFTSAFILSGESIDLSKLLMSKIWAGVPLSEAELMDQYPGIFLFSEFLFAILVTSAISLSWAPFSMLCAASWEYKARLRSFNEDTQELKSDIVEATGLTSV